MNRIYYWATDFVLAIYVYMAAAILRVSLGAPPEVIYTTFVFLPFFGLLQVMALWFTDAYCFERTRTESDVAFAATWGVGAGMLFSFLASTVIMLYYFPSVQVVPRSVFLLAGAFNLLLLPGWRVWYTRIRRRRGDLNARILVVGPENRAPQVAAELTQYSRSGHTIVGCVLSQDDVPLPEGFAGHLADLARLVEQSEADEVVLIADNWLRDPNTLVHIMDLARRVRVHILPSFYDAMVGSLDLYEIGGLPLIELNLRPPSFATSCLKRAMDIAASAMGLLLSSPILLWAVVMIRRDSPGPIFYRQERCGLNGKPFSIIKLRTMRVDAERDSGPVWAGKEDPRVTPIGRFLRAKRIDELPQFWNVLRGDMSLVGPRPERPFFTEAFTRDIPVFPLRLIMRPGVTSLSHVWGRYDSTPSDRLLYDLVYISNYSLFLDIRILVDTVKTVITGRGAQ